MKKPSSKIREEIARLQDSSEQAETREAERIGRIALKAGLGEIEIDEGELLSGLRGGGGAVSRRPDERAPKDRRQQGRQSAATLALARLRAQLARLERMRRQPTTAEAARRTPARRSSSAA